MSDEEWENWTPAAKEKLAVRLREIRSQPWSPFYCPRRTADGIPNCDGRPHGPLRKGGKPWNFPHARGKQHPPRGDWFAWALLGGRGSGKTRGGAEYINRLTKVAGRIALVAPTSTDAREVIVEGESGILAKAAPGEIPEWEPSKRRLTWPNGAIATTFSAEEPGRLRGPQHHAAWLDEPAHMPLIGEVWSNLLLGLRLGRQPRVVCTTTPVPIPWLKELIGREDTVSVVMPTYDNLANLPEHFRRDILARYEGTRLGRQEIEGELLSDVEGALWSYDMLQFIEEPPEGFDRIVVSIDPAGTANARSDETGIIVIGAIGDEFFVLDDLSGKYKPNQWARTAIRAVEKWDADYIVAERNYGGDMVKSTIEGAVFDDETTPRIVTVNSRRGKVIRADPIVAIYERSKVWHMKGLGPLEDQLLGWIPGQSSPDRLDAVVHGITDLAKTLAPATVSSPLKLNLRSYR